MRVQRRWTIGCKARNSRTMGIFSSLPGNYSGGRKGSSTLSCVNVRTSLGKMRGFKKIGLKAFVDEASLLKVVSDCLG